MADQVGVPQQHIEEPHRKSKQKRTSLSIADKIWMIRVYEGAEDGQPKKQKEIAALKGVSQSTVSKILAKKDEIERSIQMGSNLEIKRRRPPKFPTLERALWLWFCWQASQGIPITSKSLTNAAKHLAPKLGVPEFNASAGWVDRWKNRHRIQLKQGGTDGVKQELNEYCGRQEDIPNTSEIRSEDDIVTIIGREVPEDYAHDHMLPSALHGSQHSATLHAGSLDVPSFTDPVSVGPRNTLLDHGQQHHEILRSLHRMREFVVHSPQYGQHRDGIADLFDQLSSNLVAAAASVRHIPDNSLRAQGATDQIAVPSAHVVAQVADGRHNNIEHNDVHAAAYAATQQHLHSVSMGDGSTASASVIHSSSGQSPSLVGALSHGVPGISAPSPLAHSHSLTHEHDQVHTLNHGRNHGHDHGHGHSHALSHSHSHSHAHSHSHSMEFPSASHILSTTTASVGSSSESVSLSQQPRLHDGSDSASAQSRVHHPLHVSSIMADNSQSTDRHQSTSSAAAAAADAAAMAAAQEGQDMHAMDHHNVLANDKRDEHVSV